MSITRQRSHQDLSRKMLANGVTYGVMAATLVAVAAYAITMSRHMEVNSVKNFVSAKNSMSALRLAWCFFAAGIGAGSLFTFPEIGVDAGSWGVIGYTLSGISGMIVLALVGPYIRSAVGENVTMTDVVSNRFGYTMRLYIGFISMFYQFICLASEYTCIAQLTTMMSPDAHPIITILLVAFLTNLYLTIGGLRASLATDVWQGIGVVALVGLVCIAMFFHVSIPDGAWSKTNVAAFTTAGFETLVTLVIAVTASNLFFTGFWQRVYAAYDDHTLYKAAFGASVILTLFTVALAMAGMRSVGLTSSGHCCGAHDLLSQAFAAARTHHLRAFECPSNRDRIPAIRHYDSYLIADLFCTVAVGPMLLGTWKRATRAGAFAGNAAGFLTIFIYGVIAQGKFVGGFNWFVLPEGLYSQNSMITFILTLIIPPVVTVGVSLMTPETKDDSVFLLEHSPVQEIKA
ncbi:hypothetical protein PF008_g5260 [Phytophthora fragariae]|uniref:Uncharacterized protein n=1 Tax=Phytophthora fragariae TaxID=53985 RepID=A0A6G0S8W7_9STRA|nr:hypothetical protein PF008_g5260 [Phytophthora fragariae]